MTKLTEIYLENNALQFDYFPTKPESNWIPWGKKSDGIFYKPIQVKYPYLALSQENKLIQLDDKEAIDINPFNFIIRENQKKRATINLEPHDFVIGENLLEVPNGTSVIEIRTKNNKGEWQDWQAILGSFNLYSVLNTRGKRYLHFPIEDEITNFKKYFEIRYSGFLHVSYLGDAQIIDDDIKTFNPYTREIKFFADSDNPCYPFKDRVRDWRNFINKYHKYDSKGTRL